MKKQVQGQTPSSEPYLRKALLTADLERKIIRRKELPNGYAYTLPFGREILKTLSLFVETEQEYCDVFDFTIIERSPNELLLEITGPVGAKEQGVMMKYCWR